MDESKPLPPDIAAADKACKATGKKLTPKQRLLAAKSLDPNLNQAEAYREVYGDNAKYPASAATMALANPKVQQHIDNLISKIAPNIGETAVAYLNEVLTDPDRPDSIKLKALDMLSKWSGWNASTKVDKRILTVNMSKYKLPGTSEDNE